MNLLLRWVISAAAVWLAVEFVPGITLEDGYFPLFAVAFIMGGVNLIVRPILSFLACGVILLTLGLFLLVINAAMLLLTAEISQALGLAFHVETFGAALLGSLVISIFSFLCSTLLLPKPEKER